MALNSLQRRIIYRMDYKNTYISVSDRKLNPTAFIMSLPDDKELDHVISRSTQIRTNFTQIPNLQ